VSLYDETILFKRNQSENYVAGFHIYFSPTSVLVMARYSHKGHDTIRYESASPYVRTTCCQLQTTAICGRTYISKQATAHNTGLEHHRSAYQHCRHCRCLDTGRPARWRSAGGRFPWIAGSFSRATVSTGRQTIEAVESLHSCYCLAAARHGHLAAARVAVARLQYLVIVQSFLRVVRNIDFVWGVIIAIKICHDTTSISRLSIQYDITCHH